MNIPVASETMRQPAAMRIGLVDQLTQLFRDPHLSSITTKDFSSRKEDFLKHWFQLVGRASAKSDEENTPPVQQHISLLNRSFAYVTSLLPSPRTISSQTPQQSRRPQEVSDAECLTMAASLHGSESPLCGEAEDLIELARSRLSEHASSSADRFLGVIHGMERGRLRHELVARKASQVKAFCNASRMIFMQEIGCKLKRNDE